MAQKQPQKQPQTLIISNFGGRLTRIQNGDINSGFAKFDTSWGYDPFTKPMNLTWFAQPTSITSAVTDTVMAMKPRVELNTTYVYALGQSGRLYKYQTTGGDSATVDSIVGISSVKAGGVTYLYAASMEFFGTTSLIYVGTDQGMNKIRFDGSADTQLGSQWVLNTPRPQKVFQGKLLVGNGNTFGVIDNTGTVTSSVIGTGLGNIYSQVNPPLPTDQLIKDIDVSIQGDYALFTANGDPAEQNYPILDRLNASSADSNVFKWNGVDTAFTAFQSLPSNTTTALQTYLGNNMFFSQNAFGGSVGDGVTNLLTLPNNKSPQANATAVNGNFLTWITPETLGTSSIVGSLYYYGSLDTENPKGLYRVMRYMTAMPNGFVYQTPANLVVNNYYTGVDQATRSSVEAKGYGKHYFSTMETSAASIKAALFRFVVNSNTVSNPQQGVYETQTQLFSKRIGISQIRVYTEPTVAGNAFQLDMIDVDGSVVTNGSFSYTFGQVVDPLSGSTSLERINFNPGTKSLFGLGIRITNTGTTNMTIKKVEIDYTEEGK